MAGWLPSLLAVGCLLVSSGGNMQALWWVSGRPAPLPPGQQTLRLAVDASYPPFANVAADGSLVGLEVDVAHAIARELHLPLTLTNIDAGSGLDMLTARAEDGVLAQLAFDPTLTSAVQFTAPYFNNAPVVLYSASNSTEPGHVVEEVGSPLSEVGLQLSKGGVQIERTWDLRQAENQLAGGAAFGILLDRSTALEVGAAHPTITLSAKQIGSARDYGYRVAMGRSNRFLAYAVDQAVRQVGSDGTLSVLEHTWFGPSRGY